MDLNNTKKADLNAFLRDDYDFENYVHNRKDESSDVQDIFDSIKQGNTDSIDDEKKTLKCFLDSDNADIKSIINMGKNDDFLRFTATKLLTKLYDSIVNGAMKQQHESEKKSESERTEAEQKKLNQMSFKMGIEIAREMARGQIKSKFDLICDMKKTIDMANENSTNYSNLNVDTMIKIANDKKSMLAQIIKLAGHYQRTFSHKIRTSTKGYEVLTGIGFGNELDCLLPEEVMYLDDEDYQDLKNLDLINQQLQQYTFKGNQPTTSGKIICLIDESGSMYGERIINAKAYCFGLYQKAKSEKRDFKVIRFGCTNHAEVCDIKSADDLINISSKFFEDGGTDFETPLAKAKEIIESDSNFKKSDIIMITDDGSTMSNSFLEEFKKFKSRMETKLIVLNLMHCRYGNLGDIADEMIYGNDFDELVNLS